MNHLSHCGKDIPTELFTMEFQDLEEVTVKEW